ncbi:GntR family transcriptional regulator [Candidatus Chlorohelix sp.]|uniref:GntR family transcriptional regulator n=1 Tax=Candidatus Chlorohelix sp. TaxID=3139201 RepID=UPI00304CB08C
MKPDMLDSRLETQPEVAISLKKLAASSQSDAAYTELKRRIIRCELEPGQRITEAQLVGETGIGKTPIREALTRLAQEGLVNSIRGHGYEVTPITLGELQDLFSYRIILEGTAAQLAAGHVKASALQRLDELCRVPYNVGDVESEENYWRANFDFHVMVAEASGNRRLAAAVRQALEESERVLHLSNILKTRKSELSSEHEGLVEALIAGDGETARKMVVHHITASQQLVLEALVKSPSLHNINIVPSKPVASA